MQVFQFDNRVLQAEVSTHGGELLSLKKGRHEYLWQGDETYWGRHAPILFPNVGKVWNDEYRVNGRVYSSKQHGFARDTEFIEISSSSHQIQLECLEHGFNGNLPYKFKLDVIYTLVNNVLQVKWNITNEDSQIIYFQIGAHPGFYYRNYNPNESTHGFVRLYDCNRKPITHLTTSHLTKGYKDPSLDTDIELENGLLPLSDDTFVNDAIILENHQVRQIDLLDRMGNPYIRVSSPQAEVFGLWSPNKADSQFMCIEPWCGRTDCIGFMGDISQREYIQQLAPSLTYQFEYRIQILDD